MRKGVKDVEYFYYNDTRMIALYENVLYMCGTSTLYETYRDFFIEKNSFNGCSVNNTALKYYNKIKQDLFNNYFKIDKIVGWSLGSMIAILFSYDLFIKKGIKINMYLFGTPPIGNKCFKIKYDKYLKHVTHIFNNKFDYIANPTMFVPVYLINKINYHHVGNKINNYKYNYNYPIISYFVPHLSYF